jgi:arylformamidase
MSAIQFRARFDAEVTFSNGGGLTARGFRVDVPGPEVTEEQVARLFLSSLGLLMTESVQVSNLEVFPEPHKGTRGGPSDVGVSGAAQGSSWRWVELSHAVRPGMITYSGPPGPEVRPHLTSQDSRRHDAAGREFAIDAVWLVGNTGTNLDSPWHRYPGGTDLAGVELARLVDLPAVVVRTAGSPTRPVDLGAVAALDVAGRAVLLHTGGDRHWGTPDYAVDAPYLTSAAAEWLVEHGARLVGIDAVNIDAIEDKTHPAHSLLLAEGIPIVEHLTGLDELPPTGARFTAAPPRFVGVGSFPVRAYAAVPA